MANSTRPYCTSSTQRRSSMKRSFAFPRSSAIIHHPPRRGRLYQHRQALRVLRQPQFHHRTTPHRSLTYAPSQQVSNTSPRRTYTRIRTATGTTTTTTTAPRYHRHPHSPAATSATAVCAYAYASATCSSPPCRPQLLSHLRPRQQPRRRCSPAGAPM